MAKYRSSDSFFERQKISLARLAEGDVGSATTALLNPEELSPRLRETLVDRWAAGGTEETSWLQKLLGVLENPLVLIGAALAYKFPLPTPQNILKLSKELSGLERNPGALRLRAIGNLQDIYGDLPVTRAYQDLIGDKVGYHARHSDVIAASLLKGEAALGKRLIQPHYTRESSILVALREGWVERGLLKNTPEVQALKPVANEVAADLASQYKEVLEEAKNRAMLVALKEHKLSYKQFQRLREDASQAGVVKKVLNRVREIEKEVQGSLAISGYAPVKPRPNYFPHRLEKFTPNFEAEVQQLVGSEAISGSSAYIGAATKTTPHALSRHGRMVPSPEALDLIQDLLVDPNLPKKVRGILSRNPNVKPYNMNFSEVLSDYTHSMARAYGWTVKGHGKTILDTALKLEQDGRPHNKIRAAVLRSTYIPAALGQATYGQYLASATWDGFRLKAFNFVNKDWVKKVLPSDIQESLSKSLAESRGFFSLRSVQGRLASHLNVGALGANPVPLAFNLMQNITTGINVIGPEAMLAGYGRAITKGKKYFNLRIKGSPHLEALQKAFPEFTGAGISPAPLVEESLHSYGQFRLVGEDLRKTWETYGQPLTKAYGKVKAALLLPYRTTEAINRISLFEGSLYRSAKFGQPLPEALRTARDLTEMTQFLGGPASLPVSLVNKGPLLRQFGAFPLGLARFLLGSATELGSGAQATAGGRNYGTLGRVLLSSGLAYEAGKELLGADLTRGLLPGGLPTGSYPGTPFYPFPFVPPAASLAGGAFQALLGDSDALRRSLPLLVPGGAQLSRLSSLNETTAKIAHRPFADYDHRDDQGRIGYYSPEGKLLTYLTPTELYAQSFGLLPGKAPRLQEMQELERYLVTQRRKIVGYKREFIDAQLAGDFQQAERIQEQYQKEYPKLGRIQVRPKDRRAVESQRKLTRLQRILKTFPENVRPQFEELLNTSLANELGNIQDVDPGLLSSPQQSYDVGRFIEGR